MHIKIYSKIYKHITIKTTYEQIQSLLHEVTQSNKPTNEFDPSSFLAEIKSYSIILSSLVMHEVRLTEYR